LYRVTNTAVENTNKVGKLSIGIINEKNGKIKYILLIILMCSEWNISFDLTIILRLWNTARYVYNGKSNVKHDVSVCMLKDKIGKIFKNRKCC
jgi:hypothetical protein